MAVAIIALHDAVLQNETGWVVRISLSGDGFASRALPLTAEVGDERVEGLITVDGGAVGFLRSVPPAGARLRIGYRSDKLQDTDITFGPPINA